MERITLHRSVPQPFRASGVIGAPQRSETTLTPELLSRVAFHSILRTKSSCKLEAWYSNQGQKAGLIQAPISIYLSVSSVF